MTLKAARLHTSKSILELFSGVQAQPWSMLLDSANVEHPESRYSIMVWQPLQTLAAEHKQHSLESIKTTFSNGLVAIPDYQGPEHLPFRGGWLGAFSYEFGRWLERISDNAQADIDHPDVALGLYDKAVIFDHNLNEIWLLAPATSWQLIADDLLVSRPLKPTKAFKLLEVWQSNLDKTRYAERFKQVKNYIAAGDCYQINLAQRFKATFEGNAWHAYCRLRDVNGGPFSSFIRLPQGAILSLSPERFLKINGQRQIEAKPIKGTSPRAIDPVEDMAVAERLKASEKDRAENVMIVDLLRNDLSRVCQAGSVNVPALFNIESFPAVHHLVSTVTGTLRPSVSNLEALLAAFPGGSITGAPKVRAMQIIDELEPHQRSFYCGSIGYWSAHGVMDSNIAIRTLVTVDAAQSAQIYCWAGGGLVWDSQCDAEYQETFDKVQRILPTLEAL